MEKKKGKGKKVIVKKRVTTDTFSIEGFLKPEKLVGFCVDVEEEGLKDFSKDIKEFTGKLIKITITAKDEKDLLETGFVEEE